MPRVYSLDLRARVFKDCNAGMSSEDAEQHREYVIAEREEWKQLQETLPVENLVFIDETWTKTNMTPLYGRAAKGKRVVDYVPHGHWKTTTFIAALR